MKSHSQLKMWQMFRNATTKPLAACVLATPKHKQSDTAGTTLVKSANQDKPRQSPRLEEKSTKDKPILKMAQELVAKRCGILKEDKELDTMTLH
jgi:hypothetical protein